MNTKVEERLARNEQSFKYEEVIEYIHKNCKQAEKLISSLEYKKEYILNKLNKNTEFKWICPDCKGVSLKKIVAMEIRDCKYCKGKAVLVGFNDLETYCNKNMRMEILEEWANGFKCKSSEFTYKSNKSIELQCKLNHRWTTTPKKRVNNKVGCPYCSNQKLFSGYNDLQTRLANEGKTKLLEYWSYEKNNLKPNEVFAAGSNWWKCFSCSESFFCRNSKFYLGRLCLRCRNKSKSSLLERNIVEFLKIEFKDIVIEENVRLEGYYGFELDIFIQEKKLGIEVNGEYWHSGKTWTTSAKKKIANGYPTSEFYHRTKKEFFNKAGIELAYLWESDWIERNEKIKEDLRNFINNGVLSERFLRLE